MSTDSVPSKQSPDSISQRRRKAESLIELYYRNVCEIAVISVSPPIVYIPIDTNVAGFVRNYKLLFDSLRDRKAYVVCPTYWYFEKQKHIDKLMDVIEDFKIEYPNLTFSFLSNTVDQDNLFREKGLDSYFCNHNCFVDENIFRPLPDAEKKFDAVYDARLDAWKRHGLAANIESLGLIYHRAPVLEDASYIDKIRQDFSRAKFFNHTESGEYETLTPQLVNQALNECRVGLCLSAEEGAMFASMQYLLAGLPVVTTPSLGGRDVFFDDEIAIAVAATPEAVVGGVQEMISRNLDAEDVRARTVEKVLSHRERFVALGQSIYEKESVERNFATDFEKVFTNKLLTRVSLNSVIKFLHEALSSESRTASSAILDVGK
jgi:glycosyltransferase involved in cell wall biosynthesis